MAASGSARPALRTVLGLLVAIGLALAFAWVAFGPGPRECTVTGGSALVARHAGGETVCRAAFGVVTVLAIAIVLLFAAAIVRLRAPGRFADGLEKTGQWLAIVVLALPLLAGVVLATPVWIAKWVARRFGPRAR